MAGARKDSFRLSFFVQNLLKFVLYNNVKMQNFGRKYKFSASAFGKTTS
jgi:hypothetical protein